MADRHAAPSRPAGAGIAKARAPATSSNVRRNLFQSQLTRRPTSNSSTSTETLRLDTEAQSESSDIVIRDKNGEIELGDPPTPPVDEPEDAALDASHQNEKERQRLAEAVKQHQIDQNSVPAQPEGNRHCLVPSKKTFGLRVTNCTLTPPNHRTSRSCSGQSSSESRGTLRGQLDV